MTTGSATTPGQLYTETRERLGDVVRSLPADQLATPVPATPAWTVKDVVAHLVGGATDLLAGVYPVNGIDPWSAAHVAARQDRTLEELLDEWEDVGPQVAQAIDDVASGGSASLVIFLAPDVITHEQDVRNATGNPGARDSAGIDWSLQFFTSRLANRYATDGTPALRIRSAKDEWLLGNGEPVTTVEVDEYELFRALVGRRSDAQIRSWQWDGDPAPHVPGLSVFPLPVRDLVE